jgi:hypothetical protein
MEKNIQSSGNPGPGRPSLRIEVNFGPNQIDLQKQKDKRKYPLICKQSKL